MLIWSWNPTDVAMRSLFARNQVYRCSVDGCQEFCGEILPIGTEENVLVWIKALSPAIREDAVFALCIDNSIFDLFEVNELLYG